MVTRFIICCLILFHFQWTNADFDSSVDTPIALAHLEGEPSAFVHNCVNVITGQFSETHTDLIAYHGVNPLSVERSYLGSGFNEGVLGACWTLNHYSRITHSSLPKSERNMENYDLEDRGASVQFSGFKCTEGKRLNVAKSLLKKGGVNTSHGVISGQTNMKNWQITSKPNGLTLSMGTGTKRFYSEGIHRNLSSEYKPSGNHAGYSYIKDYKILNSVTLFNRALNKTETSLHYDRLSKDIVKSRHHRTITTGDGRWVQYKMDRFEDKTYKLGSISRSDGFDEMYEYTNYKGTILLDERKREGDRYLKIKYYGQFPNTVVGSTIKMNGPEDPRLYRVKSLFAPVGCDNQEIMIYQFVYHLNESEKKKKPSQRAFKWLL